MKHFTISKLGGRIISIVFFLFVMFFPVITYNWRGESPPWDDWLRYMFGASAFMGVYYINKIFLITHFLFNRKVALFLITNLLLSVTFLIIAFNLTKLLPTPVPKLSHPDLPDDITMIRYVVPGMIMCILISAISVASKMTSSWYTTEAERKELERSRSEAELQNLKSQLNPHFLFNTLNNIYSMIAINQEKAQEAVHELSRLLRYVLYESSDVEVSVEKDFDFIRNYVELMRIRLSNNVKLTTEITTSSPQTAVAPLLLITLVENAFKHGVSNSQHSFINISIVADERRINCSIENSYFPKTDTDKSGSGIGLANLQKRLALIYGGRYMLSSGRDGDAYRSTLLINLT